MKKIFKYLLIAVLVTSGISAKNTLNAQSVNVSLSVFQNALSPYGRWVNHGNYGQVWISNNQGFVPYETDGHWAYTDYGWTWVSDYDWGWAPFHYGRWGYESGFGWYWVPDYDWAPAWVAWRSSGDYYGWAPLSPGLNISVGIGYANNIPSDRWVFAPHRYITSPYINRYYAPRRNNITIIRNTTVINNVIVKNNVHVDAGPRREDVERVNHTKIQTYKVANSSRPGKTVVNNNTVNVYRPVINKTTVNNNNKTVINKNSNNTTVNKNNNNTTVNKPKTTVNNTTTKNINAPVKKNNTNTSIKKPAARPQQKPANRSTEQTKPVSRPQTQHKPSTTQPATEHVRKPAPKPQATQASNSNVQLKREPVKPVNHNPQQVKKTEQKPQPAQGDNNPPQRNGKKGIA